MTQSKLPFRVTLFAGVFYLITAALHTSAFGAVTAATTKSASADVVALVQLLWLGIGMDLLVFGLIVIVLAFRPAANSRPLLVLAGLVAFGDAALQLKFLGFIPPTPILAVLGLVTLVAAFLQQAPDDGRLATAAR